MTFGFDAGLGPIASTSHEFAARTSPDEAAYRAHSAAAADDLEEAASHLARARTMLEDGATPRHTITYREPACSYAKLGDAAGTANSWRAYLAALDGVNLKVESDLVPLQETLRL